MSLNETRYDGNFSNNKAGDLGGDSSPCDAFEDRDSRPKISELPAKCPGNKSSFVYEDSDEEIPDDYEMFERRYFFANFIYKLVKRYTRRPNWESEETHEEFLGFIKKYHGLTRAEVTEMHVKEPIRQAAQRLQFAWRRYRIRHSLPVLPSSLRKREWAARLIQCAWRRSRVRRSLPTKERDEASGNVTHDVNHDREMLYPLAAEILASMEKLVQQEIERKLRVELQETERRQQETERRLQETERRLKETERRLKETEIESLTS